MNILKRTLIVWSGKLLSWLSKTCNLGSGTSVTGILIEKYIPSGIKPLTTSFEEVILISGTNGKTTTRALINKIYQDQGVAIVSNYGGANIYRGIASSLIQNTNWYGKPKATVAILEVEEATLPKLTRHLPATTLILTNIFRDQLDAYGEINQTLEYFKIALEQSPGCQLIINQDDSKLCNYLSQYIPSSIGFSIDSSRKPLYESSEKLIHKPNTLIQAKNIHSGKQTSFTVQLEQDHEVCSNLPGVFNIYNILGAISATYSTFGESIFDSIKSFENVFGRGEQISIEQSNVNLFLVKNPAGCNEVLRHLSSLEKQNMNLLICLNDNIADGQDVSWIWDVDFESFIENKNFNQLKTSGTRGLDMLLRLEYAGREAKLDDCVDLSNFIQHIKTKRENWLILCTYTALLDIRKKLQENTNLKSIADISN